MKPELSYPLNNPVITQVFGANGWFYNKPQFGNIIGHNGIDFNAYRGQPIYATHDGLASYQVDSSAGHGVVIISKDNTFKTIYWHLCDPLKYPEFQSPIANKGFVNVCNGDLIGYADNTGASTGDHLHFGFKFVVKGENNWTWMNTDQNNGYNGAIDPMPYFDKSTPLQVNLMKKQVAILSTIIALLKKILER
jgi:murein DD-endopeptidase MepM/ murein hydrolase activator NlpD